MTIRRVFEWMIGFIDTLFTQLGTTGNYSAIADPHTLHFTVTHALGFSVFTSRILVTDYNTVSLSLQITHEVFFPQPNSLLAIILQLAIMKTEFNSIPLLPTSYPGWRSETRLTLLNWTLLYNYFARTTQKTQPLYCCEGVFTAPLHSNGSYSIVACVFVAAGTCLRSCCLEINVYSDFSIPAFGCHDIICTIFEMLEFILVSIIWYCHVFWDVTIDGVWLVNGLLSTCTNHSELQVITKLSACR
jgi:hypothetical protein